MSKHFLDPIPTKSSVEMAKTVIFMEENGNVPTDSNIPTEHPCKKVMAPLYGYMRIIGLNHSSSSEKHLRFFRLFNRLTVIVMIASTIRRFTLLQFLQETMKDVHDSSLSGIFTASSSLIITHTLFHALGCLAAVLLYFLQFQTMKIRAALDRESEGRYEDRKERLIFMHRIAVCMMLATLSLSVMNAVTVAGGIIGFLKIPFTPPLIMEGMPYGLFDAYVFFIGTSSIMAVGSIFGIFCVVLRCKTQRLALDMNGGNEVTIAERSRWSREEAYKFVYDVQRRYQALQDANRMMEEHFSYALFVLYACAIPIVCFLLYAWLRGQTESATVILAWICNVVGTLLYFSYPAFKVQEEGEKIVDACFTMYHQNLCQHCDTGLLTAILFFAFQVRSSRLTLTAGNFFYLERSIVLTLFSAILTYFIILMQFYTDAEKRKNVQA